jgi:hypothetical protein
MTTERDVLAEALDRTGQKLESADPAYHLLATLHASGYTIVPEATAQLGALDLRCENFMGNPVNTRDFDLCFKFGRTADAKDGADRACWPCIIRAALAAESEAK